MAAEFQFRDVRLPVAALEPQRHLTDRKFGDEIDYLCNCVSFLIKKKKRLQVISITRQNALYTVYTLNAVLCQLVILKCL